MSFASVRHTLFTIHMWVGLILGVLLAALGLSGSLLVYDETISDWLAPAPPAVTGGSPLPLSMLAGIARDAAASKGIEGGQLQLILPETKTDALVVRIGGLSPMGNVPRARAEGGDRPARPRQLQVYLDPVSGEVLGTRNFAQPSLLTFAHQLHGNFLMSRETGRPLVGWLGVAMCALGISGLVLWWPKRGQWKYAFKVRSTATGLRFHRELHAATGIWIFLVFMAVSFSGVVIAWPQTMGLGGSGAGARGMPMVEASEGQRLGPTEAVIAATAAVPDIKPRTVTIPARPDQPVSVNYRSHDAVNAAVLIDPYSGKVLMVRDNSERFLAWMRPVHDGTLGFAWRFLVFLSGLVPTLFIVTGLIMWWKKRQRRVPMTAMTEDVVAGEAAA
ncbi:MAG TPA: PepSY-associated TM helix domain-containing protein [Rhizomicrobium sp.]|nr:PepSY-associated TM helix domain-containing protein [Rhizomicrobium sp.]